MITFTQNRWLQPFIKLARSQNLISRAMSARGPEHVIGKKRQLQEITKGSRVKRKIRKRDNKLGPTTDDVLHADIRSLLKDTDLAERESVITVQEQSEADVAITRLSSTGEGLGLAGEDGSQVFVVPFSLPGDVVRVKAWKVVNEPVPHTLADFIRIVQPSTDRDDGLVECRYFGQCSGCQFQMLPYGKQLANKKAIIQKAFRNFSHLPSELIPTVQDVHPSPLQYGFRTKLNPHFEPPRGARRARRNNEKPTFESIPPIGFQSKGKPGIVDIEECPIGSNVLQLGLKRERQRVADNLKSYHNGATILLRESTNRRDRVPGDLGPGESRTIEHDQAIEEYYDAFVHTKTCITDNRAITTEYINDYKFSNPAGSFFQNNNSILPSFISYIQEQIRTANDNLKPAHKNLVDAYCGSGLFSITLSPLFERTIGIDIDGQAIESAKRNMLNNTSLLLQTQSPELSATNSTITIQKHTDEPASSKTSTNAVTSAISKDSKVLESSGGLQKEGVQFISADAAKLFESVAGFDPEQTVVILDPPRKGCDESFLKQLLQFAPDRIIYISCNVHTQARDIGLFLRGMDSGDADECENQDFAKRRYNIISLTGFDFFPQTTHVEGIAVLDKRRSEA